MKPVKLLLVFLIVSALITTTGCNADNVTHNVANDFYTPLFVNTSPSPLPLYTPSPLPQQVPSQVSQYTSSPLPQYSPSTLRIGDYVQFGQYDSIPLVWKVIDDSSISTASMGDIVTGDPILFSVRIICKKAFDVSEITYAMCNGISIIVNKTYGSSRWETSALRAWLNSSSKAGEVAWPKENHPTEENVTENAYAEEKGFLADGNFTESERLLIKPFNHKSLLYYHSDGADGGSEWYDYSSNIKRLLNNYDSAYYQMVTDRVFLLDPKQLTDLYNRFYDTRYFGPGEEYWICAPDDWKYKDSSPSNVLYVGEDGTIFYKQANDGSIGVRPAMILDGNQLNALKGSGTFDDPYSMDFQE